MKPHERKILKFLFTLFLVTGAFLFATAIFAQDFGVNEVGNEIALPSQDPRVFAANIIRVALGFLGIVAVAIVLYGGFVWMTAAGNEERLSKAKKILSSWLGARHLGGRHARRVSQIKKIEGFEYEGAKKDRS